MSSPFYLNKSEYESTPLYWLPSDFAKYEDSKPAYINGSRGTGKTSLLRALWWEERLKNDSLRKAIQQTGRELFDGKSIGIYVRTPDYMANGFNDWPEVGNSSRALAAQGERFSLYLELVALQRLVAAIQGLRRAGILHYTIKQEEDAVDAILAERPELKLFLQPSPYPAEFRPMLNRVRAALTQMHRTIRDCAERRAPLEPLDAFRYDQIGAWIKSVGNLLMDLTNQNDDNGEWRWKLCLDEAECLNDVQQRVINTLARVSTHPFSLIVAFVTRPWDITSTFVPHLTNADADVSVWNLDQEYQTNPKQFRTFAEGVLNLRLQHRLGASDLVFDPNRAFGRPSINQLIQSLVNRSARPELKEIVNRAAQFGREHSYYLPKRGRNDALEEDATDDDSDVPPIYQWYVATRLGIEITSDVKRSRLQDSSQIRKAQVAALICFCREFNFSQVPYRGWNIMLHLSDSCIRDTLRQVSGIYEEGNYDPQRFAAEKIDVNHQLAGIRNASMNKFADIRHRVLHNAAQVEAMVDGVGRLLGLVQGHRDRGLRTIERAILTLRYDQSESFEKAKALILEAQDGGFITIVNDDNKSTLQFVLHRLFAPKYGISFRKPLNAIELSHSDILQLGSAKQEVDRQEIAREIGTQVLGGARVQLKLGFDDPAENDPQQGE
ncbi:MAG: ORC-CDC6 family AAA ATPase [Symbiobacteriia bacterium]